MRSRRHIQHACVLLAELIFVQCFEKITFSKQLYGGIADTLNEFTDISIHTCIELCKRSITCEYIEYRPRYHLCNLNVESINTVYGNVLSARGCVSSRKTDWNMTGFTGCLNCSNKQLCVDNGASCETKICGAPPVIQSSTTIGNMFNVGNQVCFLCENSSDRYISECSSNGSWNTTGIQCNITPPQATTGIIGSGWEECRKDSYTFVRDLMTWQEAKLNCELIGSQLAKIKNDGDHMCVQEIFNALYGGENVKLWLGANDIENENIYTWADGEAVIDYTNWNNNQPDNALGNEDCVGVGTRFFYWNDMECSLRQGSICYLD